MTILLVTAVLLAGPFAIWLVQRSLIYFPTQQVASVERLPPGWREVSLSTEDGLALAAWFHPPVANAAVVIVFNGNAGNRTGRAALGAALVEQGLGVLLTDYRGYGSNPGSPSEKGLAMDARAARDFVAASAPKSPIVYFGESLGAAVAVELAVDHPPVGLILRSPFTSLADVASVHYKFLPAGLLLRDRYPSLDRIGSIDVPLLVIAGTGDSIVPPEQSRRLFEAAADPVRLVMIDGADHNDFALLAGGELLEAVSEFCAGLR